MIPSTRKPLIVRFALAVTPFAENVSSPVSEPPEPVPNVTEPENSPFTAEISPVAFTLPTSTLPTVSKSTPEIVPAPPVPTANEPVRFTLPASTLPETLALSIVISLSNAIETFAPEPVVVILLPPTTPNVPLSRLTVNVPLSPVPLRSSAPVVVST